MTPKKRVLSAILGGRVDRIPATAVCQTATYEQMQAVGVGWPEAHLEAKKMAKLASAAYTITGLETARVPFDQTVEAEVLGGKMEIKAEIPAIVKHLNDFADLKIPQNFLERGRIPVVLDAVEMLADEYGDTLPIMGGIIGPFTIATQIFDPSAMIKWTVSKRNESAELLERLVDPVIDYGNELTKRGADIIVIEDMFSSQLGSKIFNAVTKEPLKRVVSGIKNVVILHICGNLKNMIPDVVDLGADGVSVGEETDLKDAVQGSRGKCAMIGNIDPVRELLFAQGPEIEKAVKEAIENGVDLIAPGCSIASKTSTENVKNLVHYTQRYGKKA